MYYHWKNSNEVQHEYRLSQHIKGKAPAEIHRVQNIEVNLDDLREHDLHKYPDDHDLQFQKEIQNSCAVVQAINPKPQERCSSDFLQARIVFSSPAALTAFFWHLVCNIPELRVVEVRNHFRRREKEQIGKRKNAKNLATGNNNKRHHPDNVTFFPEPKKISSTDACITLKVLVILPYFDGVKDFTFTGQIHLTLENFILASEIRKIFRRIETAALSELLEPLFPEYLKQV